MRQLYFFKLTLASTFIFTSCSLLAESPQIPTMLGQYLFTAVNQTSGTSPLRVTVLAMDGFSASGVHITEKGLSQLSKGTQFNPYTLHDYFNMIPAQAWAHGLRQEPMQNLLQSTDFFRYNGYSQYVQDQIVSNATNRALFVDMIAQMNEGKGLFFHANNKALREFINKTKKAILKGLSSPSRLNADGWRIKTVLEGASPYLRFEYYQYPAFREYLKSRPDFGQTVSTVHSYISAPSQSHWKSTYKTNKHFKAFIDQSYQEIAQAPQLSIAAVQHQVVHFEPIAVGVIASPEKIEAAHLLMEQENSAARAALIPSSQETHAIFENRAAVIEEFKTDGTVRYIEYELSQESLNVLDEHKLDHALFKSCQGSVVQQQAHTELVDVTHCAGQLFEQSAYQADDMAYNASAYAANMAAVGVEFNNKGHASRAFKISDFCYAIIDLAKGIGKGGYDHGYSLVHACVHPIDTVYNIAYGVKGLCDVAHLYYSQVWAPALQESDKGLTLDMALQTKLSDEFWQDMLIPAHKHWQSLSLEDKARLASSTIFDIVSPIPMIKKASAIAIMGSSRTFDVIRKIGKGYAPAVHAVAATAEGITAKVSRYAELMSARQADRVVSKFKATPGKLLPKLLSRYGDTFRLGFKNIPRACWTPFDQVTVSLDSLKHIFGVEMKLIVSELRSKIKRTGGHFGDVETLQKLGHIPVNAVVDVDKAGVVRINYSGRVKTLFPAHWSEKKVLKSIYEAGANITESPVFQEWSGNWAFVGKCSDGVKIEIIVSNSGKLVTAYPL